MSINSMDKLIRWCRHLEPMLGDANSHPVRNCKITITQPCEFSERVGIAQGRGG